MQLVFTVAEFRLLTEVLLAAEHDALTRREAHNLASSLLQRVLTHDLAFGIDELEDLEEVLREQMLRLEREELQAEADGTRDALHQRQLLLARILDRVAEACAMA